MRLRPLPLLSTLWLGLWSLVATTQLHGQTGCDAPVALIQPLDPSVAVTGESAVTGCPGVPLGLDGSPSMPADGAAIVLWSWNFGNGTSELSTTTDVVSPAYTDPGTYLITLTVTDDNGCTSTTPATLQAYVSPEPSFNTAFDSPVCAGSPVTMDGSAIQGGLWTSFVPPLVAEDVLLPDDFGVPFVSTMNVDLFEDGDVVTSCDDILSVTGSLYHTFIGDLTIELECPNGQSMLILDNGANGGPDVTGCMYPDLAGNNLGNPDAGVAWDYTWTDGATYIIDDPSNPAVAGGTAVPAGEYQPCGTLCDLLGCPLNGAWNFIVTDTWPADQGYLESWSLQFNPGILPNDITLTPTIGLEADSSFWDVTIGEGGVTSLDAQANVAEVLFASAGNYPFTYEVVNSFGCSFDTTISIDVTDAPSLELTAGPDQVVCGELVQLQGGFGEGNNGCAFSQGTTSYCYSNNENTVWSYCPDTPGDGTMMDIVFQAGEVEGGWDDLQVFDGDDVNAPLLFNVSGTFPETYVQATNPSGCLTVRLLSDGIVSCEDSSIEPLDWCVGCGLPICGAEWSWEPADGLLFPNTPEPFVTEFDGTATAYVAQVQVPGLDNCVLVDTAFVLPAFDYDVEVQTPTCLLNDGSITVHLTPSETDSIWLAILSPEDGGNLVLVSTDGSPMVFSALESGLYGLEVSSFGEPSCTYNSEVLLEGPAPPSLAASSDTVICPGGQAVLTASVSDTTYAIQWTAGNQVVGSGPVIGASPSFSTTYAVQGITPDGCVTQAQEVVVELLDPDDCACATDGSGCTDPEACNFDPCAAPPTEDYCLLTEVVAVHTEGELAGMTTYRVLFQALNPTDFVTSVSGDVNNPSLVQTSTTFYQNILGGDTPENSNPLLLPAFPELAYDSWVTIGLDGPANAAAGESPASVIQSPDQLWSEVFDPGNGAAGGNIVMNDPIGGAWYVLNGDANGFPDANGQVLLGQFTTDGVLSGNLMVQVFVEGDNFDFFLFNLPLGVGVGCSPLTNAELCDYVSCVEPEVPGCTDVQADNFNPEANVNDGSCIRLGCTDDNADNFDPEATVDDGACIYTGCIYPLACNYDPVANLDDGSCLYPEFGEDCAGNCILDTDGDGICEGEDTCIGIVDECGICNGPGAIFDCGCVDLEPGDCDCEGQVEDAIGECGGDCTADEDADGICDAEEVPGCTDPAACNYNPAATDEDGTCDLTSCLGCTDSTACNFAPLATVDDSTCAVPGPCDECENGVPITLFDADGDGVCDGDEIPGCTNVDATNYNPIATEDNGTCKVFGCTDPASLTYNPFATDEDGSCDYLCVGLTGCTYPSAENFDAAAVCDNGTCEFDCSGSGATGSCVLDYDGNGLIGANDLIYFLSWYELPCTP